ncbi:MAG: L-threonylcarbamoyladenylate synthase [Hydrogenovibrio sp.]
MKKQLNTAQAADWVRQGGVLAYPTEAVYGLGCDPFNASAFQQLLALKQRPLAKGVILIAGAVEQVADLVDLWDQPWSQGVLQSWETSQPTTWVLPAKPGVPPWVTGGRNTLAVRVTAHPEVQALCAALAQPLVSTSANVSGEEPIRSQADCLSAFPEVPVLQGRLSGAQTPSQIWDAQTGQRLR